LERRQSLSQAYLSKKKHYIKQKDHQQAFNQDLTSAFKSSIDYTSETNDDINESCDIVALLQINDHKKKHTT
jgi:hypothetical protein